ncbi:MAG TPA: Lrp/AsnC ligand binding domain-containing protein, partial [Steroidobacter sp.]|nr:Lrp/AsnC ligand binding domain-containing protein [Steroidobacter sp.]
DFRRFDMVGGVSAVVLIKAETSSVNELAQQLVELKGVAEVFSVAGQYDLVAIVRVNENEQLAEVVSDKLRKLPGVVLTETMIAFRVFTKAAVEGMFDLGS